MGGAAKPPHPFFVHRIVAFGALSMKTALLLAAATAFVASSPLVAQDKPGGDVPPKFEVPKADYDYDKREVMIPMRDGT
jgi:hypothetical protein